MANENELLRAETEKTRHDLEMEAAECREKELTRLAEAETRVAELEAKNRVSLKVYRNKKYFIVMNNFFQNLLEVIHEEKVSKSTTPEALELLENLRKELIHEKEKCKALEESYAKQHIIEMELRNELGKSHHQMKKRSLLEKCSAIEKSVSESSVQVDTVQHDEVSQEFMRLKRKYDELLIKHKKFAEFFKVDPMIKSPQKKVAKRLM